MAKIAGTLSMAKQHPLLQLPLMQQIVGLQQ
jgi:hypothetical protein